MQRRAAQPAGVERGRASKNGVIEPVLERALQSWRNIAKEIGGRIAKGVKGS
jgi:hypothetical protein